MTIHACPDSPEMPLHAPARSESTGVLVDAGLLPLLESLWAHGIETLCSCQGGEIRHGWLGRRRHIHDGYIAFADAEDALAFYLHLIDDGRPDVYIGASIDHRETPEHAVFFRALAPGEVLRPMAYPPRRRDDAPAA